MAVYSGRPLRSLRNIASSIVNTIRDLITQQPVGAHLVGAVIALERVAAVAAIDVVVACAGEQVAPREASRPQEPRLSASASVLAIP